MCGIAGILNLDGAPAEASLLRGMIQVLRHRGPDDNGVYADAAVGLAHARLSIVDLSSGHQPMKNADGSLWITFNGEIFNHVELRETLARKGHVFATTSDTEVILHMYAEAGEDCVRHFNGQWAFAIWDARKRKLFLSRDRLGIRPLFYARTARTFVFGSEIKSLLMHPGVERRLDLVALSQIFTFWWCLPPRSIFQDVLELPPGHSLTVERGDIAVRRHWQIEFGIEPNGHADVGACAEQLRGLLLDATRLRLRADVPVAAHLSGGLDSAVVAAFTRKVNDTPLKTFSITFEDPELDESVFQNEAVRRLGTEHQAVHCSTEDIGREFPDVIWHTETPILRTAPAPLFRLSRLVREHGYKVVLTGEGSDEILGGYDIYKEAKIRRFWAAQPDSKLRPLLLRKLYPYMRDLQRQPDAYLKAFFRVRPQDLASPFFSHLPRWELTGKLQMFFSRDVRAALRSYDPCAELEQQLPKDYARWDPFCQAQYLEAAYLLPAYILSSQGDRVAMAHAVEGRSPFLDHRVVEFAAQLPPHLKMKVLDEKHLLKRCTTDLVPASVRRRPKQPYRAPGVSSFFRADGSGAREAYVEELLSPQRLQKDGVFDPVAVEKLVAKAKRGHTIGVKDDMAVVGILSTQLVLDRFIENFSGRAGHGAV